jgi:nicotinamide-nucleotide amidase
LPKLAERAGQVTTVSREILVVGLGESHTHKLIADIVDRQSNPTIAYLAGGGRVRVRMTAKAGSETEALSLIEPIEEEIRQRLGESAIPGHEASLAAGLGRTLLEHGIKVAVAESLTGGLIAAQLSEAPGSSGYFVGSAVCYSDAAKRELMGVDQAILDGPGAVSEEAAAALANGARERFGADLGLSATGVAGPAEQEGKPVGTIFVAAAFEGRTEVRSVTGYGDRANVKSIAVTATLDLGRRVLQRSL